MKQRVNLTLDPVTYKVLRVMAAEEGTSMSEIVRKFITGERSILTGKKAEKFLKEEGYELDEENAKEINVDELQRTGEDAE